MRKQYHFRKAAEDILIWDIHTLIKLSQNFPLKSILITGIKELNEPYWFPQIHPTTQQLIENFKLIQDADLNYPIILCPNGRMMDGMNRLAKAQMQNLSHISAVQFEQMPEPHFMNIDEGDLNYD